MPRKKVNKRISVSWHEPSGQYRKYVGTSLNGKGVPAPKCWYLGSDETRALREAVRLVSEWNVLTAQGHRVWPANGQSEPLQSTPKRVAISELRVKDGANLYLDHQHRRAEANVVTWSHYRKIKTDISRGVEALGKNKALSAIGDQELSRVVLHFVSRPPVKPRPGQKKGLDRRLSVATAVGIIKAMKAMFKWLDRHDRIEWRNPRRFDEIFEVKRERMLTDEEREQQEREVFTGEVRVFSDEELRELFKAANSKERALMLLALNCGFANTDLSELRAHQLDLEAEPPVLHSRRHKTGVYAKWVLWPETVEAIQAEMSDLSNGKRVFVDAKGRPLVEVGEKSRRDEVAAAFKKLRIRAGLHDAPTFKYLRKTGANLVKQIGGLEASEMYLAHSESSPMNRHYANRVWPEMHACLDQMREQLLPLLPGETGDGAEGPAG